MLSLQTTLQFVGTSLILCLSPGPDNLFVITLSATRGVKSGLWLVLGLCSGLVVHTLAVALGLAALLAASPLAFAALQIAGGLYLFFLAYKAWMATSQTSEKVTTTVPPLHAVQAWRRGVFMNLSNPKIIVFFLAFFPQFINNKNSSIFGQTLVLGALFIAISWITFSGFALLAGKLGAALQKSSAAQLWLNRIAAIVFAGLAIKLILPS